MDFSYHKLHLERNIQIILDILYTLLVNERVLYNVLDFCNEKSLKIAFTAI